MKYQILQAYSAADLEEKVSTMVEEGFQPSGSLQLLYLPNATAGENIIYAQAVTSQQRFVFVDSKKAAQAVVKGEE
jgi:hypothetical protein